jgi:hypothetical protein
LLTETPGDFTHTAPLSETAFVGTIDYRFRERWTFEAGAGAIMGGNILADRVNHTIYPGWMLSAGASYLALKPNGWVPFVLASLSASFSSAATLTQTQTVGLKAGDFRLGVTAGHTFAERWTPYLTARLFGGPVWWRINDHDVFGGDAYHYQVGAGLVVALPYNFDLSFEVVPLGEQRISLGGGVSF